MITWIQTWDFSPDSIYRDGDIWIVPFLFLAMAAFIWRWRARRKRKVRFDPERDFESKFDPNSDRDDDETR